MTEQASEPITPITADVTRDSQPEGALRKASVKFFQGKNRLPAYNNTAYYGTNLDQVNGEWILRWDKNPLKAKLDIWGDNQLRKLDYNMAHSPIKLLLDKPHLFLELLARRPKDARGTASDTWNEIQRLQLTNVYQPVTSEKSDGSHEVTGIQIDKQLAENAPTLWDIISAQRGGLDDPKLKEIDRFDAYGQAAAYKSLMDTKFDYVSIDGPWQIFYRNREGGKVSSPIMNVPDIIPNREKQMREYEVKDEKTGNITKETQEEPRVTPRDYQATKLGQFVINLVVEELKMQDGDAKKAIEVVLQKYVQPNQGVIAANVPTEADPSQFVLKQTSVEDREKVVSALSSFMKRGRFTFPGEDTYKQEKKQSRITKFLRGLGAMHNTASMRVEKNKGPYLRELISTTCDNYIATLHAAKPTL